MQVFRSICIFWVLSVCYSGNLRAGIANSSALSDSSKQRKNHLSIAKKLLPSALLIGYGISTINDNGLFYSSYDAQRDLKKNFPHFKTQLDDYLWALPSVTVYGLDFCGIKAKDNFWKRSQLLVTSMSLAAALTYSTKHFFSLSRPDSSDTRSFPSSHVAQAFVAATFTHYQYGEQSVWYSVGAYSVATGIGFMRMANNRHWLSDVAAGAGVGSLSVVTTELLFQHLFKTNKTITANKTLIPYYSGRYIGFYGRIAF